MKFKKERTKNTCTISALYFESCNDKFRLIGSTNCACSDQPAQNHQLAVALGQVVMARTNPPDFGVGKNIVFLFVFFPPHSAFQISLSSSRRTTLFTTSK